MTGEPIITMVGNLTADPELRYTQNGLPVVNFTIAQTPRTFDRQSNEWKDGEAVFMRCSAWREHAEHIAGTLAKGMRVIAMGRLTQKSYQDKEGNNRSAMELEIDAIGPELRYATAQVTRTQAGQGGGQRGGGQQAPQQGYAPQGNYGPPQGQQGPPMQGPPQGQQPPQQGGYPQQGPPQQQQGGYPGGQQPQQAQQPQQGPPQQQTPQQGSFQAAQQGAWQQPGQGFGDDTPF